MFTEKDFKGVYGPPWLLEKELVIVCNRKLENVKQKSDELAAAIEQALTMKKSAADLFLEQALKKYREE